MSTKRTREISKVGGGETVVTEKIGKGDGVGKSELLDEGVYTRDQSSMYSVERRQIVHPGVTTFDGRVAGEGG